MAQRVQAAVITAAFVALMVLPAAGAPEKASTPQQQKMKACAAEWKDEKAKTGAKGREAYRKFMGECLKKT